ncbi:PREDICTED: uncharacterized protein LOC105569050 [Vollenhovia emeryi]|uniref:uncharacterized protein LOC105569050 n=1 Tax=Vollenhovia emeryi TaxID=411798 RepID=UPI0005F40C61|nr:PREDICTED: uncharacterized protein LOC105569050 [Vollenhovia emeryi]
MTNGFLTISQPACYIQIHGFCDASNNGYGASLYVRSIGINGKVICRLLCAKSRVAPLKSTTIPRLELCGALLLARLLREVNNALNIATNKITLWCDSTIALHWLKTPPHLLKTFVAHRIAETRTLTKSIEWRHIKSEFNPADAISRGQLPQILLQNKTWCTGPQRLSRSENEWPRAIMQTIETPELKGNTCLMITPRDPDIFKRYSSYSKLCRIIAYCFRFHPLNKYKGNLTVEEIEAAEVKILRIIQPSQFSEEIKGLESKGVTNRNRIANLNPFLDNDGLIRIGGRLRKANLSYSQRYPILLPSRHYLTDCIIREIHETRHHTGILGTLYNIRQKFWILDGRNQVRKIVHSCVRCYRFNNDTIKYKMGNLPQVRVREAIPFANTGVDFCGPFYIKEKKHRNRIRIKVYVCIFVCMTIKAVHFEVVSDLTSDGFLAALRRFISRRGIPAQVYSDNGTVGANNQLREMYASFNSDKHKNTIDRFACENQIKWHFIPPAAPHFGGLWESTVKLFKHHFKRVVGDALFTFEELNTLVVEIEGILNSRPITSLSPDPNDLLALTPGHYLIGKPITSLPEKKLSSVPANRLTVWQHIVKKKNTPCAQWALGRILTVHPGEDGVVRAATVKTTSGETKRATKQMCPLPIT